VGGILGLNKHLDGVRRIIIHSILALEHSGVERDGNLQVCWPFSHSPVNYPILPSSPKGSHHWFRVVKDSRDTSTFAVFSQICLEFPERGLVRSFSAPCRDGNCRPFQTILDTRIVTSTRDKALSGLQLLQGTRFVVGEAHLSVTKVVPDQVAIIAAVSKNPFSPLRYRLREFLPDARVIEFKEHVRPDLTTDISFCLLIVLRVIFTVDVKLQANRARQTCFHLDNKAGKLEGFREFVNEGHDIMLQDADGLGPFHYAVSGGHLDILHFMSTTSDQVLPRVWTLSV
jgi:hypothetical protein